MPIKLNLQSSWANRVPSSLKCLGIDAKVKCRKISGRFRDYGIKSVKLICYLISENLKEYNLLLYQCLMM